MKTVTTDIGTFNFPNNAISSAYAGACAAHQVDIHEDWFGKDKVDFTENFMYLFNYVKEDCVSLVEDLPDITSLQDIADNSPANYKYGGF